MKKLFILALTALTFACNHIDTIPQPNIINQVNTNLIIGSWVGTHYKVYAKHDSISRVDSSYWLATTTDTMICEHNKMFIKYTFNNDMSYKAESLQGITYGTYLINNDSIKIVSNNMADNGTTKLTINSNIMYFNNIFIKPNGGFYEYEMKFKKI